MSDHNPILIVDDSDFDRELLTKALTLSADFPIIQASSGEECLEILEKQQVSLILMDILMPGLHGSAILKKIREKHNPIELPIIMITSKSETSEVVSCLKNGANDYIIKPVNFEVAVSRISTHLKLAELSVEMSRLKEVATLNAVITTYNHEINNPLSIAIGCINSADLNNTETKKKLNDALWRVADIVKKIKSVSEKNKIEYQDYSSAAKMLKVK